MTDTDTEIIPKLAACVHCQERPADFDVYLCRPCADHLGVMHVNVRDAYGHLTRLWGTLIEEYRKFIKDDEVKGLSIPDARKYNINSSAPAATFASARRFHYFTRLYNKIADIPGDIVECGVGEGASLIFWMTLVFDDDAPRNVWGFDLFDGFFRGGKNDANPHGYVREYDLDTGKMLQMFWYNVVWYGLPGEFVNSRLIAVQGTFEQSFPAYTGPGAALVHIDANWYDSYKQCLEFWWPRLSPGGVVVLDEYVGSWDLAQYPGAKRAVDEFVAQHGLTVERDRYYGKQYIVKPRG